MRKIPCLNLTKLRMKGDPWHEEDFHRTLIEYIKESGYTSFHRVYVGSSFCCQYFLSISSDMMRQICKLCEKLQIKITLVIPITTQKNLIQVKDKLHELVTIGDDCLDEITVNDFGMLHFMNENYEHALNLGRLFMKDYRDIRYEDYFKETLRPRIINPLMVDFIQKFKVTGLEFDLTHKVIDLIDVGKEFMVGIHYPYCYQTVGHICEAGSIDAPIEQKFRPSQPCSLECESVILTYRSDEGVRYYKQGRAVFFENTECNIINREEIRLIYTPKLRGGER